MTHRIVVFAAVAAGLAILPVAAWAQEELRLRGVVVDEQGAPAANVDLSIEWQDDGRTEAASAADGSFELKLPRQGAPGRLLRAMEDEGRRQTYYRLPWDLATLPEGPLKLELAPAKRVEVHVVNGQGRAVEGATVGLLGLYWTLEFAATDAAGKAVLWSPSGMEGHYLFAFSKEHGIDYRAYVLRRGEAGDTRAAVPPLPDAPVEFTLADAKAMRVVVTESGGGPLAGIRVYPWLLQKRGEPDNLNLSYVVDLVQQTTDEKGVADFPWIPGWQQGVISFWPSTEEFVHARGNYDPKTGDGTMRMALDRLAPIRGRVTRPDGAPAAGVDVLAAGENYQMDGFRGTAVTDADGRYEIKAAPNMVYLVIARDAHDGQWAAEPQTGFALMPGTPRENVNFKLGPATRIFGKVTVGPEREPLEGQRIEIYQYGDDANNIQSVELPNPEKSSKWVRPLTVVSSSSDAEGRFELFIGPGKFDIRGPQQVEIRKFTNADEPEREFNFHSPRREKGILRGLVVVEGSDDANAATGATVMGIYRHMMAGRDLLATADDQGKFEVERELHRTVLYARSADGKLAGVAEIGPDDKLGVVVIRPTATATGRLLDANGKPMAGQEITVGTRIHLGDDDAPFRTSFGGKATTDEDGRFTLESVVLEVPYEVSVTIRDSDAPQNMSWRRIFNLTAAEARQIDLGDVSYEGRE